MALIVPFTLLLGFAGLIFALERVRREWQRHRPQPVSVPKRRRPSKRRVKIAIAEAVAAQREHEKKHHEPYDNTSREVRVRQEIERRLYVRGNYGVPDNVDELIVRVCNG